MEYEDEFPVAEPPGNDKKGGDWIAEHQKEQIERFPGLWKALEKIENAKDN